jgi:hypothetical protein
MTATTDARRPGRSYAAGEEFVVKESDAAVILRVMRRGVDLVEVIDDRPSGPRKLPG